MTGRLKLGVLGFRHFVNGASMVGCTSRLKLLCFRRPNNFHLSMERPFVGTILRRGIVHVMGESHDRPYLIVCGVVGRSKGTTPRGLRLRVRTVGSVHMLSPSQLVLHAST